MMADELASSNYQAVGSLAFQHADAFTAREEGGITYDDGTGHASGYGIDQTAHPDIDVTKLTPRGAQEIRHKYWTVIDGDRLAQTNPKLALMAYDTAIMAGPARAMQFLTQSGGDPNTFMQLRSGYLASLVRSDPARYGRVVQGWAARDQRLGGASNSYHPQYGYGGGGQYQMADYASYSLSPYTLPPRQPHNFLESVAEATSDTAAAKQQQQAQAAPAQPQATGPLLGAIGASAPLGLKPGQPQQPAPVSIPRPMDYYLALLKRQPQPGAT
jgi:Glycosyl hydrolase 108